MPSLRRCDTSHWRDEHRTPGLRRLTAERALPTLSDSDVSWSRNADFQHRIYVRASDRRVTWSMLAANLCVFPPAQIAMEVDRNAFRWFGLAEGSWFPS